MVYQERLLLYADVLGWSTEIQCGDGSRFLSVVRGIHKHAESHNQSAREELISKEGEGRIRVNPMALEVQFGAFSDHFVFSVPDWFGGRILTKASQLMIDLLRAEFLIRGAVVLGPLYHCDNVVFGPALLEAVEIEENEVFYPRILISDAVVDHCSRLGHDLQDRLMITDQTGRLVINPFAVPFDGPDEAIESVARLNFFLPEIQSIIDRKIIRLENEGRHRHAEKWRYLCQFIGGPVLDATPQLRALWQ
jgi:hypothetical protein